MTTNELREWSLKACDHCGRRFEPDVRYPATTRESTDGTVELYSFCDDACQAAWREQNEP